MDIENENSHYARPFPSINYINFFIVAILSLSETFSRIIAFTANGADDSCSI